MVRKRISVLAQWRSSTIFHISLKFITVFLSHFVHGSVLGNPPFPLINGEYLTLYECYVFLSDGNVGEFEVIMQHLVSTCSPY